MKASTIAHKIILLSLFPRSWGERQVTVGVCVCVCVRAHAGVCVSYRAHSKDSLNDGEHQVEQPDADHSVKQGAESGSAGGR